MQRKALAILVVVLIGILVLVLSLGSILDRLDPGRELYDDLRVNALWGDGRCEQADEILEELVAKYPKSRYVSRARDETAECYYRRAMELWYEEGDPRSAIEQVEMVMARYPGTEHASRAESWILLIYSNLSDELLEMGEYDEAVRTLEGALKKYPDHEDAGSVKERISGYMLERSEELAGEARYEESLGILDELLRDYRDTWGAELVVERMVLYLYDWGFSLQEEGKYGEALEKFGLILDEHPDLYLSRDDGPSGDSHDLAREAIASCRYGWAGWLRQNGDFEQALEKYLDLLDDDVYGEDVRRDVPETCYQWAESLEEGGMFSGALETYLLLLDDYSQHPFLEGEYGSEARKAIPRVCFAWASSLEGEERFEEALEKYGLIVSNYSSYPYPGDYASQAEERMPGCYYDWASSLIGEGRYDEGLEKYSVVLEEYPDSDYASDEAAGILGDVPPDILYGAASKCREAEEYDTAIMLFKGVADYSLDPDVARDAEKAAIETEIERIYKEKHGELPSPRKETDKDLGGDCELTVINDTPYELTILMSGPETRSIVIRASPNSSIKVLPPMGFQRPPQEAERATLTLKPGSYDVAAKVSDPRVIPFYGKWSLEKDAEYSRWMYIMRSL